MSSYSNDSYHISMLWAETRNRNPASEFISKHDRFGAPLWVDWPLPDSSYVISKEPVRRPRREHILEIRAFPAKNSTTSNWFISGRSSQAVKRIADMKSWRWRPWEVSRKDQKRVAQNSLQQVSLGTSRNRSRWTITIKWDGFMAKMFGGADEQT